MTTDQKRKQIIVDHAIAMSDEIDGLNRDVEHLTSELELARADASRYQDELQQYRTANGQNLMELDRVRDILNKRDAELDIANDRIEYLEEQLDAANGERHMAEQVIDFFAKPDDANMSEAGEAALDAEMHPPLMDFVITEDDYVRADLEMLRWQYQQIRIELRDRMIQARKLTDLHRFSQEAVSLWHTRAEKFREAVWHGTEDDHFADWDYVDDVSKAELQDVLAVNITQGFVDRADRQF